MLSNSLKQTNHNNDINNNADFKSTYPAAQRAEQYKHNRTLIGYDDIVSTVSGKCQLSVKRQIIHVYILLGLVA